MVKFKPHIAKVTMQGGDSVYNQDTGDYETQAPTEIEFSCRVSPNGSGQKRANKDGIMVDYSWTIHAGIDSPKIPYGSMVFIYEGLELKAKGVIIGSFTNSMNTRIWL